MYRTSKNEACRVVVWLLLCGASILAVTGCGGKQQAEPAGELVVLCGSSFVGPTEQLMQEFTEQTGIQVIKTVAGSEDFLPLIETAQQGDILVTHDPYLDYVADANALSESVHVGYVAPVLAVQKGNPKNVKGIEDLTREGLQVALTDPQYSTCGEMVFALLETKGIKDAVLANVGNRLTKGHSTLGNYLQTQVVDAVIMWNGVAHTFVEHVDVVRTPYEYDDEIRVHVIGLNYTKQPDVLKKFVEFARSHGETIFSEHGYVK